MRHLLVTDSDIIEAIGFSNDGYKGITQGALEVVFKASPNVVYRYEQVSTANLAMLLSSDSIGKSFHELIKKSKMPFTKSDRAKPTLKK